MKTKLSNNRDLVRSVAVAIFLFLFFVPISRAQAASLTSLSDVMSRQAVSKGSNHEIHFTTPTGVDASTDTIRITFPSDFSLSSIVAADVALFHGASTGLETTDSVAASPAAGVWGASVSGQILILTAPTNAGSGQISAGQKVVVRVGQINNPSTSGRFAITLAGTFGDTGTITVPITDSDSFSTSVTVARRPASSGTDTTGGGGGGTVPEPKPIPVPVPTPVPVPVPVPIPVPVPTPVPTPISIHHVPTPTESSPSSGGSSGGGGGGSTSLTIGSGAHAPIITHVRIISITDTSAVVMWETDEEATTQVEVGTSEVYDQRFFAPGRTREHAISVAGLLPNMDYHLRVQSVSPSGVAAFSGDQIFHTLVDQTPPIILLPPATTTTTGPVLTVVPRGAIGRRFRSLFFDATGALELEPDARGRIGVAVGRTVLLRVPNMGLDTLPQSGSLLLGARRYALTPDVNGTGWAASFETPTEAGEVSVFITLQFSDGTQAVSVQTLLVQNQGRIVERSLFGPPSVWLPAADITLSVWRQGTWVRFANTRSSDDGTYLFMVPNGRYQIHVEKAGYLSMTREILVEDHVVGETIALVSLPANATLAQVVRAIQNPQVQQVTQTFVAPATIAIGVANAAAATSAFNLLNYLRFLFTQPLLLLGRKRRKQWGVVYNALSKQPLDLAIVRLLHAETGVALQTRVTDGQGRFSFSVPSGKYRLQVAKAGFVFPTAYLKQDQEDGDFLDLYHGEPVHAVRETVLAVNIPVDPVEKKEEPPARLIVKRRLRQFQQVVGVSGTVIAAGAFVIAPSLLMGGLLAAQLVLYLIMRRFVIPRHSKDWGVVYDAKTRQGLGRTIVRIFDKRFNKLLETQVTDKQGKYAFFAAKSVYYVTAEHQGYEKFQSPELDLSKAKEPVVHEKIPLKKE